MSVNTNTFVLARGKTLYDGATIDSNNLIGVQLEGQTHKFPCTAAETAGRPQRDGSSVEARLVRNVSGVALLPSRSVVYQSGHWGKRVDGYARTTAERIAGIVDDHLPATGVPNNDCFWLITKGKVLIRTTQAADATNVLAVGDRIVNNTAASSTGTTAAGLARLIDLTGATAVLAGQALNTYGTALTARTTGNTNTLTLFEVNVL